MGKLKDKIRQDVQNGFKELEEEVKLVVFTQERDNRSLMEKIVSLSELYIFK